MGREFGESNNYRQAELSKATGSAQQENKFSQGRAVDKIPCDCPQEAAVFTSQIWNERHSRVKYMMLIEAPELSTVCPWVGKLPVGTSVFCEMKSS